MAVPMNQAAHLIVSAQSVITDLTTQYAEIQQAIDRQQTLVDSLLPVAEWGEEPEPEETEEPTE